MQVGLAEFLQKVSVLKTDEEKVAALRYNDSEPLRYILKGAFDPAVNWLIPEGPVPYKPNRLVDQEHILINQIQKLHYFVEGQYDNLKPMKRELMFIEFLERLAPEDAKLICSIKEKKLPFEGITLKHVKEAIPDLMEEWPEESFQKEIVCPHCGRVGKTEKMMHQYHFDNCPKKKQALPPEITETQSQAEYVVEDNIPTADENGVYRAPDLSSL